MNLDIAGLKWYLSKFLQTNDGWSKNCQKHSNVVFEHSSNKKSIKPHILVRRNIIVKMMSDKTTLLYVTIFSLIAPSK